MLKKVIDNKMSVRLLEDEIKSLYPKEEKEESDISLDLPIPPKDLIASTDAFVNNDPLLPTAELPKDTSDFGKVTIAPPEGEEMPVSKFINYGEIEKEDDEEDGGNTLDLPTSIPSIDINEIKSNSTDLNTNTSGADLDSLLNISGPSSSPMPDNFITPAEKIVDRKSVV